jgi:hypothetical protein
MAPAGKKKHDVRGRPHLLDHVASKRVVDLVKAGNFPETAAAAAGISRPTLRGWLLEGAQLRRKRDEGTAKKLTKRQRLLMDFSSEIEKAFGEAEARDVLLIGKHAESDWRAAAWRLERRNRAQWSPVQRIEATSTVVNVDGGSATETARDWVLAKLKRLQEAQANDDDGDP